MARPNKLGERVTVSVVLPVTMMARLRALGAESGTPPTALLRQLADERLIEVEWERRRRATPGAEQRVCQDCGMAHAPEDRASCIEGHGDE